MHVELVQVSAVERRTVSHSSLMQRNTAELLDVGVVTAQRVEFVVEVVVERRQLVKPDAVAAVRQQIAEVQSAVTSSDAEARQLT